MIENIKEKEFRKFIPLIEKIMGNLESVVSDYGKDNEGTFWFILDFGESDPINVSSIHVQFGKEPLILTSNYFEDLILDVELDYLYIQIVNIIKQYKVIESSFFFDVSFLSDDDNSLHYQLRIEVIDNNKLPLFADIDEIIRKINDIIISHKINPTTMLY